MGRSEWVFLVKSKEHINNVFELVKLHNTCEDYDVVGEQLEVYALVMRNKTKEYYLCIGNGGGREQTNLFLRRNYKYPCKKTQKEYYKHLFTPFNKPLWFTKDKNLTGFWVAQGYEERMNAENCIKTPWDVNVENVVTDTV